MNKTKFSLLIVAAVSLLVSLKATAEDMTAARKIFADHQDSVVWVVGVAKLSFSPSETQSTPVNLPDEEVKVSTLATMVDTNGLAVSSLTMIDPARSMDGRNLRTSKGPIKIDATSTLKEIKVVMPDGTEIPAELVMKDENLDLAIIRIKTDSKEAKGETFPAVDLRSSASCQILDPVVSITRMDEVFGRAANVIPGYVNMMTKKPRVFIRASGASGGCPTFDMTGKLIGITAAKLVKGKQPSATIVPATDVLEIVQQAAHAKPATPATVDSESSPVKEQSE